MLTAAIAATAVAALGAASASAATINSPGPLTEIGITPDLNCSVRHTGDTSPEFFSGTACGTFVTVAEKHYGPAQVPGGNSGSPAYTLVSQTPVTGTGSASAPFTVTTAVGLEGSGLRLKETDSYIEGQESYTTDVMLESETAANVSALLYRAGDCFLQESDTGFGSVQSNTGAVACVSAVETSPGSGQFEPGSRIEQWFPLSPGSSFLEAGFSSVWQATVSGSPFSDTCACTEDIDNGGGLSWAVTVPASSSVTRSSLITFSPTGRSPLFTTKTADSETAEAGGRDGYTITISNPNTTGVTISAVTDSLPAGFSYVAGSSSGATTADPSISGQTLNWSGPISVPAASGTTNGKITLHFGVTVAGSPNTYFNNAGGSASEFTVAPTGNTAPVTVVAKATPPTPKAGVIPAKEEKKKTLADLAAPVLGKSVNVEPVSGSVFIKLPPGAKLSRAAALSGLAPPQPVASDSLSKGVGFIPLTEARQVPVGSTLDTTEGVVKLATAEATTSKQQLGEFTAGIFTILQARKQKGLTNLTIVNASPKTVCATVGKKAQAASTKHLSHKVLGLLKGSAHGKYTTNGTYSAATVRGTIWSVANRCDGTLTAVTRGVVSVRDLVRRKTITLRAGQHYLAKAP